MKLGRKSEVVFDGVSGPQDFGVCASGDGADHIELDGEGERGRETVNVDFLGGDAFRFKEDLVTFFIRELDDLIFDRRAIARPDPFDQARSREETGAGFGGSGRRWRRWCK